MIFVTVGAQMPFDRLIRAIDQWAQQNQRSDIYAQIGLSEYQPVAMQWTRFLEPEEFKLKYAEASTIVGHAGTGSIITALQLGKPILVMPRRAELRETRNNHQVATCEQFQHFDSVSIAWDEAELLHKMTTIDTLSGSACITQSASNELIQTLREFIDQC